MGINRRVNWMRKAICLLSMLEVMNGGGMQDDVEAAVVSGAVNQSARDIPVVRSVDVVVVGGTVPAVSAAVAAAKKGASVFLVAPQPYLGEDLCATLRLHVSKDRVLTTAIEKELFADSRQTTPTIVKSALDTLLLKGGVDFVFSSHVTDVLRDSKGDACGVVMANRAGRQAIQAKVIIDATDRAWVCRMAGSKAQAWQGTNVTFRRTIIGPGGESGTPVEHVLKLPMTDLTFSSFARAEQFARDTTFRADQLRSAEVMFYVPPDPLICRLPEGEWKGTGGAEIGFFQPLGVARMYVLGGCAGIPREAAEQLLQPAALSAVGMMIGEAAAEEARGLATPVGVHGVGGVPTRVATTGDIREGLMGVRAVDMGLSSVKMEACGVPVLGEYDVVVVGGGTAGAPAGIGAARHGSKVLVIEYQEGLGGVGTLGLIGRPYHGIKMGFAKEIPFPMDSNEPKMEWYRREILKAGGDVWLGVMGVGALVDGNLVKGVVVSTPGGRGVVLAKVVIDATGNGDTAVAAGAAYMFGAIEEGDIALQGVGLSRRPLDKNYVNSDYLLVDESDVMDVRRAYLASRTKKNKDFDAGSLIQSRERRRVVGDYVMTYLDQVAGRTYPDTVVQSQSDYDSHGYPTSPFFMFLPHDEKSLKANHPAPGGRCDTPYRCLLPRGLDGLLVAGIGISMDRDATAMMRMQLDIANQGYAAGVAASMAAKAGTVPRRIDVKALQRHLVSVKNLPAVVLTQGDSFPLPEGDIRKAVSDYGKAINPETAGKPLAVILTHMETAKPLLMKAYEETEGRAKLLYAQILGMAGVKAVLPTLLDELSRVKQWDAKIMQGHMADYAHLPTPVDQVIVATGFTRDRSVTPAIVRMLNTLDASATLSHHRAVALALEQLCDPAAAKPLALLLQKPGMRGYAMKDVGGKVTKEKRTESLREIALARALYRCGDDSGLGETILREYSRDVRGLFARHAARVLAEKTGSSN